MSETLQAAASARTGRRTGPFPTPARRRRYLIVVGVLLVIALLATYGILGYGNRAEFMSRQWVTIAGLRVESVVVILVVAFCQSFATVSFQTATQNRILTPSIMGFESMYVAIQTAAVFFLGISGVTLLDGPARFFLQAGLMVLMSVLLYSWLLSGRFGNLHIMLLVGVVVGGGLGSLSTFMQRLLEPNEFDILSARLLGSISNASTENLPYVIPVCLAAGVALWLRSRRMNLMALGRDATNNLGLNHRRELMTTLLLVSVMMAMTTSLVGPMTFLGFLVATLAYSLTDTYDHRLILPVAFLAGYSVLALAYFTLRNVFYAGGAVTVIVELVGGLVFLIVLLRKGRL